MSDKVGMKEMEKHLRMEQRSIRRLIDEGMPARRSGYRGLWRFSIRAVDDWFRLRYEKRQRPAAPSTPTTGEKPKVTSKRPGVVDLAALSLGVR